MSIDLWISVLLAIPLAIIANVFTPKVQVKLDKWLERSKKNKVEKRQKARQQQLKMLELEFDEISKYHKDKHELTQLFLISLIKIAMYGAIGTVYGMVFPIVGEFTNWYGIGGILGRLGTPFVALAVAMLIFATCSKVMKINKKVRDFEVFEKSTQETINKLRESNV